METAKKSKTRLKGAAIRITESYREYLLTEGSSPASVFMFCKKIGLREDEFYECFGSFEAIEKSIWTGYFGGVKTKLTSDSDYGKFTAREKILAFYFSLTEVLKGDRSFVLFQLKNWRNPAILPSFLRGFHASFEEWATEVIAEGKSSGEIAKRPYIDQRYQHVLWLHFLFILQFWVHDDSAGFERTDAAIEKSVNLAFDLIGKGILDSTIDFGKFLYQNSKA
jgi:hypothetical protein